MKRLNIFILTSIVVFLFSCSCTRGAYYSKHFQLIDAFKQITHPGVQGIPSTKNYSVKIVIDKDGIDGFQRATIYDVDGEKPLKTDNLRVFKGKQVLNDAKIEKGDTISLFISLDIPHDDVQKENVENDVKMEPIGNKEKAELVLEYVVKGKKYYYSIDKVSKKVTVYAP